MPETSERNVDFSLLGGPLHQLGCRMGLVRGNTNTIALGLALGVFLWTVLSALSFIEGVGRQVFSLETIGAHARLLVAIPLFFLCESWVDPRMTAFAGSIMRTGIVTPSAMPSLQDQIIRTSRWRDSWLPEAVCLLVAVLISLLGSKLHLVGATATYDQSRAATPVTMTGWWYWIVCMTVFRFLLFRWLWQLWLWWRFLWSVAKLELHLVPIHPDGAAGLGSLEGVQTHFLPMVMAISVVMASSFAEELSAGTMAFDAIYPALLLVLVADAALLLGPLCIFTPKLWACRIKGMSDYMGLAARYVGDFEKKWAGKDTSGEPLLGTPDLQSLADLSNSVGVVRNMRRVPMSPRLLTDLMIAALLPMLPLLLMKYPVAELAQKVIGKLSGL